MTSWPWMKGIDVAIADPIDPVDKYDVRPSVKELIETHRVKIDKLKGRLEELKQSTNTKDKDDAETISRLFDYENKHDDRLIDTTMEEETT